VVGPPGQLFCGLPRDHENPPETHCTMPFEQKGSDPVPFGCSVTER
jgi:hypothetical protein